MMYLILNPLIMHPLHQNDHYSILFSLFLNHFQVFFLILFFITFLYLFYLFFFLIFSSANLNDVFNSKPSNNASASSKCSLLNFVLVFFKSFSSCLSNSICSNISLLILSTCFFNLGCTESSVPNELITSSVSSQFLCSL